MPDPATDFDENNLPINDKIFINLQQDKDLFRKKMAFVLKMLHKVLEHWKPARVFLKNIESQDYTEREINHLSEIFVKATNAAYNKKMVAQMTKNSEKLKEMRQKNEATAKKEAKESQKTEEMLDEVF